MPLSPEWLKLPKRHCDDCGKLYKPVKPRRGDECGFCSDNCRKSYHKHGGAYRKLKGELDKLVTRELARQMKATMHLGIALLTRLEEPCELCHGTGQQPALILSDRQPKGQSRPCVKCVNGAVLTPFGREVLDFVDRHLGLGTAAELMRPVSSAAPSASPSTPSPAKTHAR